MKAALPTLFLILFVGCSSTTTTDSSQEPHTQDERLNTVAIVSAMTVEQHDLLRWAAIRESEFVQGVYFQLGELGGMDVVFLVTGPGLNTAARTTGILLEEYDIDVVFFSGVAGGIDPDIRIGDVSIASRWARHDDNLTTTAWHDCDTDLLAIAGQAAGEMGLKQCVEPNDCLAYRPAVVVGGNGVTGEDFISSSGERERLQRDFEAQSVDMQTSEIARVAAEHQVPFIASRGISDLAGRSAGGEYRKYLDLASYNAALITLAMLLKLSS